MSMRRKGSAEGVSDARNRCGGANRKKEGDPPLFFTESAVRLRRSFAVNPENPPQQRRQETGRTNDDDFHGKYLS